MPRKSTAAINWLKDKPLEQAGLLHSVGINLWKNTNVFATPPLTEVQIAAVADDLMTKYSKRLNGPVAKLEFKNALKKNNEILHQLAAYTDEVANGTVTTITLAGFAATNTAGHPPHSPSQPQVQVKPQEGRRIKMKVTSKAAKKTSYVYIVGENHEPHVEVNGDHISIAPGTGVVHVLTTGKMHEGIDVSRNADRVFVKVMAQNTGGKSVLSPTVDTRVLD